VCRLQLISEYNGEDKFMTRIGVGGLINLDRIHQASLLLNDIRLFHQHAAAAAAASSADCGSNRRSSVDDPCSQDVTPETASEQSAPRLLSDASGRRSMRSRVCMTVRLGCPSVCLSVCLSRRSRAPAACGWFAAERGRLQQISTNSPYAAHALSSECG